VLPSPGARNPAHIQKTEWTRLPAPRLTLIVIL
jgi:hypothetical protein